MTSSVSRTSSETSSRATNSTKSVSNFLSVNYDHTFVYAKHKAKLEALIKRRGRKWEVPKNNIKEYKKQIAQLLKKELTAEQITEELKELTKYPRFIDFVNYWYVDKRGVYRKGDLGGVKNGNTTPLFNPLTKKDDPVPPGGYRFSETELARLVAEDRIHFHTDGSLPTIKRYLDENPNQRPKGIMSDDQRPDANLLTAMGISFDNPKQLAFMKRVLSIFESDALILDFFAGSGTTGHAVAELNNEDGGSRRVVLITNNEGGGADPEDGIARAVTRKRLLCVAQGYTAKNGKPVAGLGGAVRYLIAEPAIERSESLDVMKLAFRARCADLLRLREWAFDVVREERGYALYRSDDKLVGVLYRLGSGQDLIDAIEEASSDLPVALYAFSLDGDIDASEFVVRLGPRAQLRGVPSELLDTYLALFRRRLYGAWKEADR